MRYVRYRSEAGAIASGVLAADEIADLEDPLGALLARGGDSLRAAAQRAIDHGRRVSPASVTLLPPIAPTTVVAPGPRLGATGRDLGRHREFYLKSAHTLHPPAQRVPYREAVGTISYRAQLGIVVQPGTGRWPDPATVLDKVLGIVLVAELMSVDLLRVGWEGTMWHTRFGEGASFDGATVCGPWLATDEDAVLAAITLSDQWGDAAVDTLSVADELAYVGRWIALEPSLLVLAGSPHGPVLRLDGTEPLIDFDAREPRVGPGDRVSAAATGLGTIDAQIGADLAVGRI